MTIIKLSLAALLALTLAACPAPEVEPMPDAMESAPDADGGCPALCAIEDTDLSALPSNRCPGRDVAACVEQCNARTPAGDWCPAP